MNQISNIILNDEENKTKRRLEEIEEEIKTKNMLLRRQQLVCPTCNESLTLYEGTLILQNSICDMDEITNRIDKLTLEKDDNENSLGRQK